MIDLQNAQDKVPFTKKLDRLIRAAIEKTFEHMQAEQIGVSVLITDDDFISELNGQYRQKSRPTDVLSFPLFDEQSLGGEGELGDIVISLERAQAQALEYGHSLEREVSFLTVHSMLHLLGYDHEEEEKEMFALQKEIMGRLKL